MKTRYKCSVVLDGFSQVFKRYGETVEEVKSELEQFIKDAFGADVAFTIADIQPDKTHPVEQQEELSSQTQENTDANANET